MNRLFLIPARGGSKGIPGKNIKPFNGRPLLHYSIDVARYFSEDSDICVSTDDYAIKKCAEDYNLPVPFLRPAEISGDAASMNEVIRHALEHYESAGIFYDQVVLLQPTSPLRRQHHVEEALALYHDNVDMVVSVVRSKANPYYNLFEEDNRGFLHICKGDGRISGRQSAPEIFMYNGAIYIISAESFRKHKTLSDLERVVKYIMDDESSADLDTLEDWYNAEVMAKRK